MAELGDILNDTVEFDLAGRAWTFTKMNLGIMADFETAMAMRRLKTALSALGSDALPADRVAVITSMAGSKDAQGDARDMETVSGMRLILYLSLKPNHPELSEDDVGRMISIPALTEVQALIDLLSGPAPKDDGQGNVAKAAAGPPSSLASPKPSAGRPKSAAD